MRIRDLNRKFSLLEEFEDCDDFLEKLSKKTRRRLINLRLKSGDKESKRIGKEAYRFSKRVFQEFRKMKAKFDLKGP